MDEIRKRHALDHHVTCGTIFHCIHTALVKKSDGFLAEPNRLLVITSLLVKHGKNIGVLGWTLVSSTHLGQAVKGFLGNISSFFLTLLDLGYFTTNETSETRKKVLSRVSF